MIDQDKQSERIEEVLADFAGEETAKQTELVHLGGHASARIYWRLNLPGDSDVLDRDEATLIAMVLPEDVGASEEGPDGDENIDLDTLPFIDVQRYLSRIEMPVPDIDHTDLDRGVLLIEDLGETHFEDLVIETASSTEGTLDERKEEVADNYRDVIDLLVELQQQTLQTAIREDAQEQSVAFQREFTREELRWELDHYVEWGLKAQYGEDVTASYQEELDELFDDLVDELLELPKTVALRDFQSRNLMLKNDEWRLIDFQDALKAPYIYDLVCLLRDSYLAPDSDQIDELVAYYNNQGAQKRLPWCVADRNIWRDFHLQTIQRKLKDAGRFVYIEQEKGDSSFIQYYDRSVRFVREALEGLSGFERLDEILEEIEPAYEAQ